MGGVPSNMWATWTNRENQPDRHNDPTFDPLLGFPEGRKKRGETDSLTDLCVTYYNIVT